MYVSTTDEKSHILPLYRLTLKQAIECINDDNYMEVTLHYLHIRPRILVANMRPKR